MQNYFDCNGEIGIRRVINPGSFYETEELLRKMDYYGIGEALVHHSLAEGYHPQTGNARLMDEIKDIPRLHPVWVAMPHFTGEFPAPDALREAMKENGVKAVRMFPQTHGYSVSDWICGPLFDMLATYRVPLFIGSDQITPDNLHSVMVNHPALTVVLTHIHYNNTRNLYALLSNFKNLHLETIGFKPLEGIEDVCKKFGAERLIFGTGAPLYSGGAAVGMI
jgi:predicted TIM-barrel fold metal-dependent hydrolase